MTQRRRIARAATLALFGALAWCGSACAATTPTADAATSASSLNPSPGLVVIDEPDDATEPGAERPPLARMGATRVQELALRDPSLARALRLRPESGVRVRFLGPSRRWRVSVRDRGTATTLAYVELADRSGRVVKRFELPVGDYPSRTTEREAIDAAVADARVRREARTWGGVDELRARGRLEDCCWEVDFYAPARRDGGDREEPVIRVGVNDAFRAVTGVWTGHQIAWSMARGERDAFGGAINQRIVWWPLFVVFALVAIDWTRLRSQRTLDVAALLALGVSHELFLQGRIDWSVPLAVPPLLVLAASMTSTFLRGIPPPRAPRRPRTKLGRLAMRRVPTMLIVVLCVLLAGLRIGITVDGGNVIDVGYASVSGARLELEGQAPWGNMPDDVSRGDTYGPANYLAYVPAVALFDDARSDSFGDRLPAAQATSIAADLGCALLLALIGWRWISRRGGVLLAAGWLACPWTAWALASGVNDALVALPILAAFALIPHAWLRGAFIGVAAMVKFAPLAALAPLLHVGGARRLRQAAFAVFGCATAIAIGLAWVVWRLDERVLADLRTFWSRTLAFQGERDSPFSIWGLYGWSTAQKLAQAGVVLAVAAACLLPRARDAWQVAAGIAAVLIALQLVTPHWFYLYVPWFIGFVLIVAVAQRERPVASLDR